MFLTACSFLFDIFLVQRYNEAPPSVKYMTVSIETVFFSVPANENKDGWRKIPFQSQLVCCTTVLSLSSNFMALNLYIGWQSMLILVGNMVRTRMGVRQIDTVAGRFAFTPLATWLMWDQVLISIQSMILCDEPYLNEPGWASSAGTPQSQACKLPNCTWFRCPF